MLSSTVMRRLYHPMLSEMELSDVLHALGDPIRLGIVRRLAEADELCCAAAVAPGLPKSTVSHHFRILREAGLIRTRKQGVYYLSSLRREDLQALAPGLLEAVLAAEEGGAEVKAA